MKAIRTTLKGVRLIFPKLTKAESEFGSAPMFSVKIGFTEKAQVKFLEDQVAKVAKGLGKDNTLKDIALKVWTAKEKKKYAFLDGVISSVKATEKDVSAPITIFDRQKNKLDERDARAQASSGATADVAVLVGINDKIEPACPYVKVLGVRVLEAGNFAQDVVDMFDDLNEEVEDEE